MVRSASGSVAGQCPALKEGSVSGCHGCRHDVSILITTGVGQCLGLQPRPNTSTTIIGEPQQGHGRGSIRGISVAGVADGSGFFSGVGAASNSRALAMLSARLPLASRP